MAAPVRCLLSAGMTASLIAVLPVGPAAATPAPTVTGITYSPAQATVRDFFAKPTVKFVVTMPSETDKIDLLSFRLERETSSGLVEILKRQRDGCDGDTFGCAQTGRKVTVTLKTIVICTEAYRALRNPGTYRPVVTARVQGGPQTTARSSTNVVLRRATAARLSVKQTQARVGSMLNVSGSLARWLVTPANCGTTTRPFARQTVGLWFDPAGDAPATRIRRITLNTSGKFAIQVKHRKAGAWYLRYFGDSSHAPTTSRRDPVKATS